MLFHYILLPLTITLASAETSLGPRSSSLPPPATHSPLPPPPSPIRPPPPTSCSVLLSRASPPRRTEGIHSRNSLLRGLFCCNRCSRHSPLACVCPLRLPPPSVSSFVFSPCTYVKLVARRSVNVGLALFKFLLFFPSACKL